MGLPTVRYAPRSGWSTSTTVPVARSDGSSESSFIDSTGPHGTFSGFSTSMTSNLVRVCVHFSISSNISSILGNRASGVLHSGSVSQSSCPITRASPSKAAACAMT